MAHTPEIIETKEVNDMFVAYKIRCCGEEMHTSVHTVSVLIPDHTEAIEAAKKSVSDLHEAKVQWRNKQGKQ
jgi:hypothetical protein